MAVTPMRVDVQIPHGDPSVFAAGNTVLAISCKHWTLGATRIVNELHPCNALLWKRDGLEFGCKAVPNCEELRWKLEGFEGLPFALDLAIEWEPSSAGSPEIGMGATPTVTASYDNEHTLTWREDKLPPDNSYLGDKTIVVTIPGTDVPVTRNVRVFFERSADMTRLVMNPGGGSGVHVPDVAWHHYWKEGAVTALNSFTYDPNLPYSGGYRPPPFNTLKVGPLAAQIAMKSIYNSVTQVYTEQAYPNRKGEGIHCAAKTCQHELWHQTLQWADKVKAVGWRRPT